MTDVRVTKRIARIVHTLDRKPDAIGPEIIRAARVHFGPGYAALLQLERAGWVTGQWETPEPQDRPRHRVYRLEQPARDWLATQPTQPAPGLEGPQTPRVDVVYGLIVGAFAGLVVAGFGSPVYGVITGIAITGIAWLASAVVNGLDNGSYR